MANVIINDTNLTNIANAIREKNGLTDTYKPSEMAAAILAIQGGGTTEVEPIVLTGNCDYACAGVLAGAYINMFGNSISTESIVNAARMFNNNTNIETIPFEINMDNTTYQDMGYMFYQCTNLQSLPKINNAYPSSIRQMFYNCEYIIEIPEDYFDGWNWDRLHTYTNSYMSSVFFGMDRLRKIPVNLLNNFWNKSTSSNYSPYYSAFSYLVSLDEIIGLGVSTANYQSSIMTTIASNCSHLKDFTFQINENGTAKSVVWNYQTIDLTSYVGYITSSNALLYYSEMNGLTADKEVKDADTYQALKNDPDWWTKDINYSRYNHDSAVRTISSLPKTQGNGCVIKFNGASGALTDGGAINTLTEEEIAVATSKGWTVSLV